jgi:hypothetical protein
MSGPVYDIAYSGSLYVRVGLSGLIQTSTDGETWTLRTSGVSDTLWGAAYGNGVFVVVGASGTVLTSSDGITWADKSAGVPAAASSETFYSCSYADVFLACGTNGTIIVSTLYGEAWAEIPSGTANDLWDITAASGTWIAVGDDSTVVTGDLTSTETDASVADDVTLAETQSTAGSNFNGSASETVNLQRHRFSHDEEGLTHWRQVSDILVASGSWTTSGSALQNAATDALILMERLIWNPEKISDGFTLTPAHVVGWAFSLAEDIALSDLDPTYVYKPSTVISENLTLDETLVGSGNFGVTIIDGTGIGETTSGSMALGMTISESFAFQALITVSGTETQDSQVWTTWVLNTKNLAVSEYDRFDFHSFAKYDNLYYGAKNDGIYLLSGDYDEAWLIKSALKTGILDFQNDFQKKMPRMYLGIRNDDTMVLKTITNEGVERWYQMKDNQTGVAKSRVTGTQGVKSAYWQFELVNVTGDDFDVRDIQLMPILTSRRIK